MSDLISRSELISRIESEYREYGEDYDAEQILGDIEDMPTAYDIDKVVEELKLHSFEFGTDSIPAHYLRFNEAIEIVNQGGVSNDVCEWKFEETNGIAWHCDDKCTTYNQVYIKDLKIILEDFECKCPYCSKKIKVVE